MAHKRKYNTSRGQPFYLATFGDYVNSTSLYFQSQQNRWAEFSNTWYFHVSKYSSHLH